MINKEMKILVVDDTPKNIQIVGGILMKQGYDLYMAKEGFAALTLVENIDFDLILLDIMMPGIDGYEVCRRIKNMPKAKNIPIIFLTAKTDPESIVKAFDIGAVDYVTKPFNPQELSSRVYNHLKLQNAQKELQKKNIELQTAIDTKNKFFSIIAHDLRSPLNALFDMSELMYEYFDNYDSAELRQSIKLIYDSSENTLNLLENLLVWARNQTGRIKYEPQPIEIDYLLNSLRDFFINVAKKKNISIEVDCQHNLYGYADEKMLQTIIRNLINNAIKFTHQGGKIILSASIEAEHVEISVSDNGVGIPSDKISKIFDDNSDYSTTGTSKEKGSGLGLILVKTFVEKNQGKLWVESEEGKGSKFSFTLPQKLGSNDKN